MHYSKGAATLLSTVFTFQFKTVVVADIVESSNEVLPGTDTAVNGLTSTPTSSPTSAKIELKRKRNHSNAVDVDTGILNSDETAASVMDAFSVSMAIAATTMCLYCDDGFVRGKDTTNPKYSCFAACVAAGASCCTYTNTASAKINACSRFTGKVCMDGSCNGYKACQNANIPSVVNSCIGEQACYNAGGNVGSIGNVIGSCHGKLACYYLGYNNGMVGNIIDSCNSKNGENACESLGADYGNVGNILNSCDGTGACQGGGSNGGSIGDITQSCSDTKACFFIGKSGGDIGNITSSCTAERACIRGGSYGGVIGSITSSCAAKKACYYGGFFDGVIGNIANSCTAENACSNLGRGRGNVGHVTNSCTGLSSCQSAGSKRGSIGSITQSCNAANACDGTGSGSSGVITSNLTKCCKNVNECKDAQKTLPTTCQALATPMPSTTRKPTPSPTSKSAKKRARHLTYQFNERGVRGSKVEGASQDHQKSK